MAERMRWGILGTGWIAELFAEGLTALEDAEAVAVGSRTQAAADRFADRFSISRRHSSYEALANDPEVDVIYVATPHPMHHDHTVMCLRAGKPVLCEKPFAINQGEAAAMVALAREKRIFLMEAMWTRYLPVIVKARELIAQGAIGEPRMVLADFGFRIDFDPAHRLFAPELGGGALLDVGVYPVAFAYMVLGKPVSITGQAGLGRTGVDEQSAYVLAYPGGQLAVLASAVRTQTPQSAVICGSEGWLEIPEFWHAREMTLQRPGKAPEHFAPPFAGNGYNYEAAEVGRCLREGRLESAVMPLDESLEIMGTLDAIRAQWGLVYPTERLD